jgi:Tfp pilus assembly protein PilO
MKTGLSILFILMAIATFFFYTEDKYAEIKQAKLDIVDYEEALRQSRDILDKREELLEKYKAFKKEDLDNLKKLLPDHIDNVQLILDLNNIAKKYGMTLKGIKVETGPDSAFEQGSTTNKSSYGTIAVSFKVASDYPTFVSFLQDVERSLRIVDITDLTFTTPEKTTNYDFGITIKTYWLK